MTGRFNLKKDISNSNESNFSSKKTSFGSVNVSDIELARSVIDKLPDTREEILKRIKEKYSDPEFEEDAEDIADKILEKMEALSILRKYKNE